MTIDEVKQLKMGDKIKVELRDGTVDRTFHSYEYGYVYCYAKNFKDKDTNYVTYVNPEQIIKKIT